MSCLDRSFTVRACDGDELKLRYELLREGYKRHRTLAATGLLVGGRRGRVESGVVFHSASVLRAAQ